MTVNIEYETEEKLDFDWEKIIRDVTEQACDQEKCPYEAEVSVTLTDNDSIQSINKEFRNIDSATDVLSFPMLEYDEPADFAFLDDDENVSEYFNPDTDQVQDH